MNVFGALRRWWGRLAARRLRDLPRGLPPASGVPLALLPPPPEASGYATAPLLRRAPQRLFRLAALPPPPRELAVLRLDAFRRVAPLQPRPFTPLFVEPRVAPEPRVVTHVPLVRLAVPSREVRRVDVSRYGFPGAPLPIEPPATPDLGVARPAAFGIDDEGRLAPERDQLALTFDRPPPPARRTRPRTPLARAPIARLSLPAFRLDPVSATSANERAAQDPLRPEAPHLRWVTPEFRRELCNDRWMARPRNWWRLEPSLLEWWLLWWDQETRRRPGAWEPVEVQQEREIVWAMDRCKEQMLIRRDVKKDEEPPPPNDFHLWVDGYPRIASHEKEPFEQLIPAPEWIEPAEVAPFEVPDVRPANDAYLAWRTLVDGFEER